MKRTALRRKSPLKPLGKKAVYNLQFEKMRPVIKLRANGYCEAQVRGVCGNWGAHVHHRKMRSHGGTNDADNLLLVCYQCHRYIHANPAISYRQGWLVKGVGGHAVDGGSEAREGSGVVGDPFQDGTDGYGLEDASTGGQGLPGPDDDPGQPVDPGGTQK